MKSVKEIRIDIKQSKTFGDLKYYLEQLCNYIDELEEYDINDIRKDNERISERVNNIENTLEDNRHTINIDNLRL